MFAVFAIVGLIAASLLGASMPFGGSLGPNSGSMINSPDACRPTVNKNRTLKVQVREGLEQYYVNNPLTEFNKNEDTWILVKENAPIPAWKVELEGRGERGGRVFGEMELLGSAIPLEGTSGSNPDIGHEVYIGTGWCNPETGSGLNATPPFSSPVYCLDPLVQDVLFVAARKGVTREEYLQMADEDYICPQQENPTRTYLGCHAWGTDQNLAPEHNEENMNDYWWSFNVYYKASKLPAEPTYDDLPCWMKLQCPGGSDPVGGPRLTPAAGEDCEADVLPTPAAQGYSGSNVAGVQTAQTVNAQEPPGEDDPDRPALIIQKSFMQLDEEEIQRQGVEIADFYISSSKLSDRPTDPVIGRAYNDHFEVKLRKGTVLGSTDHAIILDPSIIGHNGPYWLFVPILDTNKPLANTLQLGSFVPGIPSFYYEWWTPSCKPALYFYPEKETALNVKVKPNGFITESIPVHGNNGWNIIASPNGKLTTDNRSPITENYLYYEAAINNLSVPKENGWVKRSDEMLFFFRDILPKLGLNEKEQNDFLKCWIPKLTSEQSTYYVTLIGREELDRVEPIEFSVQPDTFIRVRFYFEKLSDQEVSDLEIENWNLFRNSDLDISNSKTKRTGFVVVDWGGILGNGSCGVEEISE